MTESGLSGDAIIWADGTRSRLASPHPSVIIGNKSSVIVGPGVFFGGKGNGIVPRDNRSAPGKARCPVLDGVSYLLLEGFQAKWRPVLVEKTRIINNPVG